VPPNDFVSVLAVALEREAVGTVGMRYAHLIFALNCPRPRSPSVTLYEDSSSVGAVMTNEGRPVPAFAS